MSTENVPKYTSQQSAIALHRCVVEASLCTPYRDWALHVHKMSDIDDDTKVSYLLQWDLDPADYESPTVFASDHQALSLLKKAQFTEQVGDAEVANAHAKFLRAEERCEAVNAWAIAGFKCNPWLGTVLNRAKNTIAYCLGDIAEFLSHLERVTDSRCFCGSDTIIDEFSSDFGPVMVSRRPEARFGPGVSVSKSRNGQTKPSTYNGWERVMNPSTTSSNIFNKRWEALGFINQVEVPGDVMTFVPKTRGEARTIMPVAVLNMRAQLIVGSYFKDRMNLVLKNDLRDQKRNRSLAKLGSLTDSYATIDLSAASDSIAYMLVMELLPFPWFHLLDGLRSERYYDIIRKEWVTYAKFSAMGNGFTFELESLIFYAIAEAAAYLSRGSVPLSKEEISVFGDDIIVPKDTASDVMSALQLVGFVINTKKSFISGPFRESCGGDYFNGWLVTPIKLGIFNDETIYNSWVVFYNDLYYCTVSTPRDRVDMPWCSRALRFVKSRLFEHFPSLSIFKEEWHRGIPQPTYRWLPGSPTEYANVYFDQKYQDLLPRRVLGYREIVRCRYCLPADVAGAAWFTKGPVPEARLSEMRYGLHRSKYVSEVVQTRSNTSRTRSSVHY